MIQATDAYSVVHTFDYTHGSYPQSDLTLDTNGVFYGNTQQGGAHGARVFYSLDMGFSPFITLGVTSGKVGMKVGIMDQGLDSTSVVKFGGVKATKITLTGSTYIVATVPCMCAAGVRGVSQKWHRKIIDRCEFQDVNSNRRDICAFPSS
jgi:hypothetical protein